MRARFEFNRGVPDTVRAFLHVDRLLLPAREVTGQLHARRRGCGEEKGLLSSFPLSGYCMLCFVSLWHVFFRLWPHGSASRASCSRRSSLRRDMVEPRRRHSALAGLFQNLILRPSMLHRCAAYSFTAPPCMGEGARAPGWQQRRVTNTSRSCGLAAEVADSSSSGLASRKMKVKP